MELTEDVETTEGRRDFVEYRHAILLLLAVNLILGALKLTLGYGIHSSALRSDGWNNAADFVYTLLLVGGIWISSTPPDPSHPEGHERFESLVGLAVSMVIFATGLFVLWDAYNALIDPVGTIMNRWAVSLVLVSVVAKGATGWFLQREGNRLDSPALTAIGRDQSGDMLADAAVLVAMAASLFDLLWLDPLVAGLIGLAIVYIGLEPFIRNVRDLTGRAPSRDLREEIEPLVDSHSCFRNLTHLQAHHVGPSIYVSMTVKAPGDLTLKEVHRGEEDLRKEILDLPQVGRVFIHIEPPDDDSPNEAL